jgi:hypothetical protein
MLSPEQVDFFYTNGYLAIDNFFDPSVDSVKLIKKAKALVNDFGNIVEIRICCNWGKVD